MCEPLGETTTARATKTPWIATPAAAPGAHRSYLNFQFGTFQPTGNGANDGYFLNVTYGRYLSRVFSLEGEIGYFDSQSTLRDLSAVPIMVNGRLRFPVKAFGFFGGLGLGGFVYDARTLGQSSSGWAWVRSLATWRPVP